MDRKRSLYLVTALTFLRVPLVFLFFVGAVLHSLRHHQIPWLFHASLACLILSALTDLLDGYAARRLKVVTRFGGYADPLVDKVFYLTTLPLLVFLAAMNAHIGHALTILCLTVLLLLRDQWVSFLRSIGAGRNVDGKANWSGKLRTLVNFPLICAIYWFEESGASAGLAVIVYIMEGVALVVNFLSMYVYTRYYWPSLRASLSLDEK